MRALSRRLRRLEERLGPTVETEKTRRLLARLEAGRVRLKLPPSPPERPAELAGMSMIAILNAGRDRCIGIKRNCGITPLVSSSACRISAQVVTRA